MKSIVIFFLLVTNLCLAQNFNSGGPVSTGYYQELPYEQINGKIIITVGIGDGKHKFLLDTGAPLMLSAALAKELGITPNTNGDIKDAFGNTNALQSAPVPLITLGEVAFANVPAIIGIADFLQCLGVEGIIGSNLLSHSIVQFASAQKKIILTDNESRLGLNKKNSIPLDLTIDKQSSPFIKVTVAPGISTQLLFDTGDDHFLNISDNYKAIFQKRNAFETLATGYGANEMGHGGAEKAATKYRLRIHALQVGPATFQNIVTETAHNDANNGNRMGAKLLNYGTVTIDFRHSRFYFEPLAAQNDLNETSWPISLMFRDNKAVVGVVWSRLKDTLTAGTQIIAIDEIHYDTVDICTMITRPLLQGKERAVLTLKAADGTIQKREIVKE